MAFNLSTGLITKRGQRENNQDAVFHYTEIFDLDFLEKYTELNEHFLVLRGKLYEAMKRIRSYEWLTKEQAVQDFKKKFPVIHKLIDEVIQNAVSEHGGTLDKPDVQNVIIRELENLGEQCFDLPLYVKLYGIQIKSSFLEGKSEAENAYKNFETEYGHKVFGDVLEELDSNYLKFRAEAEQEETRKKRINDAISARGRLFAVADGVAGSQEGHYASRFVTSVLRKYYEAKEHITSGMSRGEILKLVIEEIDEELSRFCKKESGTTLTAVLIEGKTLWVCWVGDTEAYLIRQGGVQRLTPGYGEVSHEEARQHFISYLGQGQKGSVHLSEPRQLKAGDMILIASDGLTRYVKQAQIQIGEIVCNAKKPQEAAETLVEKVMPFSDDNLTAVVINVDGEFNKNDETPQKLSSRSPKTKFQFFPIFIHFLRACWHQRRKSEKARESFEYLLKWLKQSGFGQSGYWHGVL